MSRIKWTLIVAIGLSVALAGQSLAQEQQIDQRRGDSATQDNRPQDAEGQDDIPAEQSVSVPPVLTVPESPSEVETFNRKQSDDPSNVGSAEKIMGDTPVQFWIMIVSAAAVIVSLMAVVLVFLTLKEARSTTRAAIISTRLTKRALDYTRENSRREQRAYVCITSVMLKKFKVGEPIDFKISTQNVGSTPAYDYRGWYALHIIPNNSVKNYRFDMRKPPRSRSVLGPGLKSGFRTEKGRPLTERDVRTVEAGKCTIFIWGEDLYTDIFKKHHRTQFRYEWTGPFIKGASMVICPEGNEST